MKKTVGVIFGGRSGEHEISIRSARTVIEQIDRSQYNVIPIAIDNAGGWIGPADSLKMLGARTEKELETELSQLPERIALVGDTSCRGLSAFHDGLEHGQLPMLDVVFPVLHGTYGEDGTIQGLLEMADIPYVGCGVLASSCGMDKSVMKALFKDAGLPICKFVSFLRSTWEATPEKVGEQVENEIGYPAFVKPANLGSSVGISRAGGREALKAAINLAAEYDRKIIVEECLDVREVECAVIGNEDPQASLPGEYLIRDESKSFLDYEEKYAETGNNEFVVPAPISEDLTGEIREMAIRAFKAIDGSGLARVDFFIDKKNGRLFVNEINTMPGLTSASGFPKMWKGSGLEFTDVIGRLLELALERHRDKSRNKTQLGAS